MMLLSCMHLFFNVCFNWHQRNRIESLLIYFKNLSSLFFFSCIPLFSFIGFNFFFHVLSLSAKIRRENAKIAYMHFFSRYLHWECHYSNISLFITFQQGWLFNRPPTKWVCLIYEIPTKWPPILSCPLDETQIAD